MDNQIKKAISKAMAKLVGFSLNEKAMNGHTIEVALMCRFRNDVWITDNQNLACTIIQAPKLINEISDYEWRIEKAMAELRAKFYSPDEILAKLKPEESSDG